VIDALRPVLMLSAAMGVAFVCAWIRPTLVIAWRRTVLALIGVLTTAALVAITHPSAPSGGIRLDPSEEPLLPVGDPARDLYADAIRNCGDDDVMVIGMETADVFTAAHLEALRLARPPSPRSSDARPSAASCGERRAVDGRFGELASR
jgi:hypothetical protein